MDFSAFIKKRTSLYNFKSFPNIEHFNYVLFNFYKVKKLIKLVLISETEIHYLITD